MSLLVHIVSLTASEEVEFEVEVDATRVLVKGATLARDETCNFNPGIASTKLNYFC